MLRTKLPIRESYLNEREFTDLEKMYMSAVTADEELVLLCVTYHCKRRRDGIDAHGVKEMTDILGIRLSESDIKEALLSLRDSDQVESEDSEDNSGNATYRVTEEGVSTAKYMSRLLKRVVDGL